ncbi:hypothetical protein WN944_024008 [Citrus x changshan-huyou]|uniref:Ubiquitin-like protease family profile domain-containing protein n=2 Tax=Citrus TaxID=2706 RepID=A0AAP0LMQ1_9ROSI
MKATIHDLLKSSPKARHSNVCSNRFGSQDVSNETNNKTDPIFEKQKNKDQTCQSAVGCKENIVATGTILEYRKPNVLVVIDMVLSPDAHLPIRTSELVYVSDGLGQHILWLEKLVSQAVVVNKMSKSAVKPSKGKLDVNAEVNTPMVSKLVIKPFKEKLEVNEEVNSPIVQQTFKKPPDIQVFDKMVKKVMKPGSQVKVDFEDTFSYKLHTYLTLEEIQDLIDMQELSQNCIVVYMRYLCAETKARLINEKFGFIHPTTLSFLDESTFKQKAKTLVDRFQELSAKQFIFLPYNPSCHWILLVIDLPSMVVHYLNSVRNEISVDIKKIVTV